MNCDKCGKLHNIKPGKSERLPAGWKRHADAIWCGECWGAVFVLRAITIPIVEPLSGTWKELEAALREMWSATTNAANWMLTEMYAKDVRRNGEEKLPPMPKCYLYPAARERFPSLPSQSVAALEQNVGKKYRAKRFDVIWRASASLPTYRYPTPFAIPNQGWSVAISEGQEGEGDVRGHRAGFIVSARIGENRWSLLLKGGPRYRRQLASLKQIASGAAVQGEMAIYRQGSGPEILCKMVAWLPRQAKRERSGVLFIRTSPEALLVTFDSEGNRLWGLHFDHVRRWQAEHSRQLQRWSYDQKMEHRPVASFQDRREASAVKYRNRMSSAVKEAAAQMAGYADRLKFAEVRYNEADHSFCEKFPWFALRERLACKFDELGIKFTVEEAVVPGEAELAAIVKLNRKDEREKRWLKTTKENLRATEQVLINPAAQQSRIAASERPVT